MDDGMDPMRSFFILENKRIIVGNVFGKYFKFVVRKVKREKDCISAKSPTRRPTSSNMKYYVEIVHVTMYNCDKFSEVFVTIERCDFYFRQAAFVETSPVSSTSPALYDS